ncbi:MAG: hypothetical protein AB1664_05960 [Thermodesulfobacteriota bacterium]
MNLNPAIPSHVDWNSSILIFLHMGKTGGSTLSAILTRIFAANEQFAGQFDGHLRATGISSVAAAQKAFEDLAPENQAQIKLVNGHVPFGIHAFLPGPAYYISLVREPIEREISSFYYMKLQTETEMGRLLATMDFEEFARKGFSADNYQTRILSGLEELNPVWNAETRGRIVNDEGTALQSAKHNVERHFLLAGPMERFDEVVVLLARRLGWDLGSVTYERLNVTPQRPSRDELSKAAIEAVKERTRLDLELYECVAASFDQDVRGEGDSFQRDLARFRNLNNEKMKQSSAPAPFWSALGRTLNTWLGRDRP